ncbi:MAG: nucleoside-diphosphate sugar epimerase/dehydratase [Elusimicrobiaceae bacterium]|nr:nucleoside-diphosphate sugar epimerase/dehydratase [Elusimicrobiaceae bacterium]
MPHRFSRYNRLIILTADAGSVALSFLLAFLLRFDFHIPAVQMDSMLMAIPLAVGIRIGALEFFEIYKGLSRYASIRELGNILKAVLIAQLGIAALLPFLRPGFPRSILILEPLLTLLLIGGSRYFIRLTRNWRYGTKHTSDTLPKMLIFGAGDMGEALLRSMLDSEHPTARIVGFLDDNPSKWGRHIHGITIFGGKNKLTKIIKDCEVDEVVVAISASKGRIIRELIEIYSRNIDRKVLFKTVPAMEDVIKGMSPSTHLRNIKLSDLLQRKPVTLDMEAVIGLLSGKTILITGAGGTIGSEVCRQILSYNPKRIILLENNNTALFNIDRELNDKHPAAKFVSVAGDIRDRETLKNIFETYSPTVIFHAAAHKHVPLMEHNPQEAVKNNVLGTRLVAETAAQYGAERFLFISTDKAVRPSSVMGATKQLAERMLNSFAAKHPGTRFMSVRFGNVLGSSGSAVQIFQEQIAAGGPVTVTDENTTRYFMTTEEAVQLILQACSMGKGGEVFVLNMGTSVKVLDLAKNLIALNGLEPGRDIKIKIIGLRPGEKLHEELFRDSDIRKDTGHGDIFAAVPDHLDGDLLDRQMRQLMEAVKLHDPVPALKLIAEAVPTYKGHPLLKADHAK